MSEPERIVVSLDELRATRRPHSIPGEPPKRRQPPSVPAKYCTPLSDLEQTAAVKAAQGWLDSYEVGKGLLLLGQVGTGKSSIAGALGVVLGAPQRCSFWPVADMLHKMQDEFKQSLDGYSVRQKIDRRDALVLDDLGTELPTAWQTKALTDVIAHRYDNGLTLIATTNLTPKMLGERLGERTVSRLHEMCDLVQVTGADRRRS